MGKIDTLTKNYIANNTVFADAFNFLVYKGRQVIDPDALTEMDSTELAVLFGEDNKSLELDQRYRDVIKSAALMTDEKRTYVILGIENQDKIHYAMPVKSCIYDALQYVKQVKAAADKHRRDGDSKGHSADEFLSGFYKDDKIKPVVTLVVYFGNKEWDGPLSLKDMMTEEDPEIMEFVQDYRIHLIQPARIDDQDFNRFHSNLGTVMKFIKVSKDDKKMQTLLESGELDELPRDAALVIRECTKTEFEIPENTEVVRVCEAIQTMMNKSKAEGVTEGKTIQLYELVKKEILSLNIAAKEADQTEEEFKAGMDAYFA